MYQHVSVRLCLFMWVYLKIREEVVEEFMKELKERKGKKRD